MGAIGWNKLQERSNSHVVSQWLITVGIAQETFKRARKPILYETLTKNLWNIYSLYSYLYDCSVN